MTELGFGLVDRRTVIVVLMTLVLVNVLFGFNMPIDTSSVLSLFVSLIFFTAYIYTARTIFRIPFVLRSGIRSGRTVYRVYRFPSEYYLSAYGLDSRKREAIEDFSNTIAGLETWNGTSGVVDRLGLIGIIVLATIPAVGQSIVEGLGIGGLFLMLLIYVIRGHFGFAVEDALKKGQEDQERLALLAKSEIPQFPNVIKTEPYYRDP